MGDKILKTKKAIGEIIEKNGMSRIETYSLIESKSKALDEKELKILIKEYHRDLASYDRMGELKEIITTFFTTIGFFLTIVSIFLDGVGLGGVIYRMLLLGLCLYAVGGIFILSKIQSYRSKKLNQIQYILDILEK